MQQHHRKVLTAVLVAALAALALAGCGSQHRKRDQLTLPVFGYHPSAPAVPRGTPAGATLVSDLTHRAALRPPSLQFAHDAELSHLRWASWGGATATATGTATVPYCTPNCAQGGVRRYRANVTLSAPKPCYGEHYYGHSSVTVTTPTGSGAWGSAIAAPC